MNRNLLPVTAVTIATTLGVGTAGANGFTQPVAVSSSERPANGITSGRPAITPGGRFVVFASFASNLVGGDTNDASDIFLRDRRAGTTQRVSLGDGGVQAEGNSFGPSISADGRFVAFQSFAPNLAAGDNNLQFDVFVRDRRTGTTRCVSVTAAGLPAGDRSRAPVISANGRFVAFFSLASDLVPGSVTGLENIFVRDLRTGMTELVNVNSAEVPADRGSDSLGVAISADGRFVAFASNATNLAPGFGGFPDVYVRDRQAGTTERIGVDPTGGQGDSASFEPAISADGRYVAFRSFASDLVPGDTNGQVDIFVRDRGTATTRLASIGTAPADGDSEEPSISPNGRFVAFTSGAGNLVPGDSNGLRDVFLRDLAAGRITRVSLGNAGTQGNGDSFGPAVSATGRFVAFATAAGNLVPRFPVGVFVRFGPDR